MFVTDKVNVVDGPKIRRYAASVITFFENNAMLPEPDGEYAITITNNGDSDSVVCTVEKSGSVLKTHPVKFNVFDEMEFPMRKFESMSVKLTRDMTEVPPIEATVIIAKFSGATIRVSA
jgi:hypothetical protein